MSATYIPIALRRQVRERAGERCEYCLIPESMTWAAHTIDHIIAEKHGGSTTVDNLALACTLCNSRKGSDLASIDERTGSIEPLFHRASGLLDGSFSSSSAVVSNHLLLRVERQRDCCTSTRPAVFRSESCSRRPIREPAE